MKQNLHSWNSNSGSGFLPCNSRRGSLVSRSTDLVFYYNRDSYRDGPELLEVLNLLETTVMNTGCFRRVVRLMANLGEFDHHYNNAKQGKSNQDRYPLGASLMFFQLVQHPFLLDGGYTHLWYMEPDCWPCRPFWLDEVWQQARALDISTPSFWMAGSIIRDGDPIRTYEAHVDHINGNALYRVGDPAFLDYLNIVQEEFIKAPARFLESYDVAIYQVGRSLIPFDQYCANKHRFVYSEFVQNWYRKRANATQICSTTQDTFFVHGRNVYF